MQNVTSLQDSKNGLLSKEALLHDNSAHLSFALEMSVFQMIQDQLRNYTPPRAPAHRHEPICTTRKAPKRLRRRYKTSTSLVVLNDNFRKNEEEGLVQ